LAGITSQVRPDRTAVSAAGIDWMRSASLGIDGQVAIAGSGDSSIAGLLQGIRNTAYRAMFSYYETNLRTTAGDAELR
jgi:hypothetical protein